MYRVISILLTELIVVGLPLRTPVGLMLCIKYSAFVAVLAYSCLLFLIYWDMPLPPSFNFIIFFVCSIAYLVIARVQMTETIWERRLINFVLIALLMISVLQAINIHIFTHLFSSYHENFVGRASGLSAEPSFFAWSLTFFVVHAYANRSIGGASVFMILLACFLTSRTVTVLMIILIFSICIVVSRLSRKIYIPVLVLLIFYHLVERILFVSDIGFLDNLYRTTGSWREISHFLGIYGAEFIGPFSGGLTWADQMNNAEGFVVGDALNLTWIVWPWSFSSMVALEMGHLALIGFIFWLVIGCRRRVPDVRKRTVCIFLIFSGLVLVPKWMVFYFLLPRLQGEK